MDKERLRRGLGYLFSSKFWVSQLIATKHLSKFLPDKLYLELQFWVNTGKKLDLKNPKTFSEKLQWLKLYNRNPLYTTLVDKYAVKQYVADKIGEQYVIPTIGVWDRVEDIEWDSLPEQFVLKCTHDSGGLVICKDKKILIRSEAEAKLKASLKRDFYYLGREWPYKNVPHKIIAEQYINPMPNVSDLTDYKWFCFDGEPKFCQVIQNRSKKETIDFFDAEWNHQEFVGFNPVADTAADLPPRPSHLNAHLSIARELSKDIPFSRIDLYETSENTYFGEVTLYPYSGLGSFKPEKYNEILGEIIKLPGDKRGG